MVASELTRLIISEGRPAPLLLIACECPAPSRVHLNRLSASDFHESISLLRLFGVHKDLLLNESFVGMLLLGLYADIKNYKQYYYKIQKKLDLPFTLISDKFSRLKADDMLMWLEETKVPLTLCTLKGPLLTQMTGLKGYFENMRDSL